jgi:hypothetical protein
MVPKFVHILNPGAFEVTTDDKNNSTYDYAKGLQMERLPWITQVKFLLTKGSCKRQ